MSAPAPVVTSAAPAAVVATPLPGAAVGDEQASVPRTAVVEGADVSEGPTEAELQAQKAAALREEAEHDAAEPHFAATVKAWYRQNIEWVIRERDLHTTGHGAEKRAELNP
jgi:hypothetical protein